VPQQLLGPRAAPGAKPGQQLVHDELACVCVCVCCNARVALCVALCVCVCAHHAVHALRTAATAAAPQCCQTHTTLNERHRHAHAHTAHTHWRRCGPAPPALAPPQRQHPVGPLRRSQPRQTRRPP
jgi:hypothetical protein